MGCGASGKSKTDSKYVAPPDAAAAPPEPATAPPSFFQAGTSDEEKIKVCFLVLDHDGSGTLTRAEILLFCNQCGFSEGPMAATILETACDGNSDGTVSKVEWDAMFAAEKAKGKDNFQESLSFFEKIASSFSDSRINALFLTIDSDRSGSLTKKELLSYVTESGMPEATAAAGILEQSCDGDGDATITKNEWLNMFAKERAKGAETACESLVFFEHIAVGYQDKRMDALFKSIDKDGSGSIEKKELVKYAKGAGMKDGGEAVAQVLDSQCNTDGDGKVSAAEWKAMFVAERAKGPKQASESLAYFEELASGAKKK